MPVPKEKSSKVSGLPKTQYCSLGGLVGHRECLLSTIENELHIGAIKLPSYELSKKTHAH